MTVPSGRVSVVVATGGFDFAGAVVEEVEDVVEVDEEVRGFGVGMVLEVLAVVCCG